MPNRTLRRLTFRSERIALVTNRRYIRGEYEPLGMVGDVFQSDDLVANEQIEIAQGNGLVSFSGDRVNDRFLSQK